MCIASVSDLYYYKICHFPTPPPQTIYSGKRPSLSVLQKHHEHHLEEIKKSIKCFWLSEHLSGSTFVETWPEELQYMPYRLDREDNIHNPKSISSALHRYYPDDVDLTQFASFLDDGVQKGDLFNHEYVKGK